MRYFNNSIKDDIKEIYEGLADLQEKIDNLYGEDQHDFSRPKVDMLSERVDDFEENIWKRIHKLEERMDKLEGIEG